MDQLSKQENTLTFDKQTPSYRRQREHIHTTPSTIVFEPSFNSIPLLITQKRLVIADCIVINHASFVIRLDSMR
jgi:hypothetical protein